MEKISFLNPRQEKLQGLLFPAPGLYNLIICHGFQGSKEGGGRAIALAQKAQHLGLTTLCFDFAGTGESEGDFATMTLSKQREDLESAIDFLVQQNYLPVLLLGRSLGGTTALVQGCRDKRVAGIITWAAPCLLEETFQQIALEQDFPLAPTILKDFQHYNLLEAAKKIAPRPYLVIQGEEDQVVNVQQGKLLYQAALNPKKLYLIANCGHQFLEAQEEVQQLTLEWIKKTFLSH